MQPQQAQILNPARVAARSRSELPRSRPAATCEVAAACEWRSPDPRGELRVRIHKGCERDGTSDDDAVAGGLYGLELREVVRHGRRRSRGYEIGEYNSYAVPTAPLSTLRPPESRVRRGAGSRDAERGAGGSATRRKAERVRFFSRNAVTRVPFPTALVGLAD